MHHDDGIDIKFILFIYFIEWLDLIEKLISRHEKFQTYFKDRCTKIYKN